MAKSMEERLMDIMADTTILRNRCGDILRNVEHIEVNVTVMLRDLKRE